MWTFLVIAAFAAEALGEPPIYDPGANYQIRFVNNKVETVPVFPNHDRNLYRAQTQAVVGNQNQYQVPNQNLYQNQNLNLNLNQLPMPNRDQYQNRNQNQYHNANRNQIQDTNTNKNRNQLNQFTNPNKDQNQQNQYNNRNQNLNHFNNINLDQNLNQFNNINLDQNLNQFNNNLGQNQNSHQNRDQTQNNTFVNPQWPRLPHPIPAPPGYWVGNPTFNTIFDPAGPYVFAVPALDPQLAPPAISTGTSNVERLSNLTNSDNPPRATKPRKQSTTTTRPRHQSTLVPRQQTTTRPRHQSTTRPRHQSTTRPRNQVTTNNPRQQGTPPLGPNGLNRTYIPIEFLTKFFPPPPDVQLAHIDENVITNPIDVNFGWGPPVPVPYVLSNLGWVPNSNNSSVSPSAPSKTQSLGSNSTPSTPTEDSESENETEPENEEGTYNNEDSEENEEIPEEIPLEELMQMILEHNENRKNETTGLNDVLNGGHNTQANDVRSQGILDRLRLQFQGLVRAFSNATLSSSGISMDNLEFKRLLRQRYQLRNPLFGSSNDNQN